MGRVECLWINLLVTVRTLVLTSAVMYMRPLLSVWSVPHRLGTLATQRLWMFIIQSGDGEREREGRRDRDEDTGEMVRRCLLFSPTLGGTRTFASHALVYEAVEQRTTVVAEGRAGVGVNLKLVLRPRVLEGSNKRSLVLPSS